NLLTWDGSTIVIDPKGELATNTAMHRKGMGQDVFILDPFNEVKGEASELRTTYNPLSECHQVDQDDVVDETAILAESLITSDGGKNEHFALSARNLIRGLCLYVLHTAGKSASLRDVREILTSPLEEPENASEGSKTSLSTHFDHMLEAEDAFDGVLAGVGGTMTGKPKDEKGSIISTAIEQTAFLDSAPMRTHIADSGLSSMRVLKRKPTTIYLVLPASRMATHARWLRMLITQAMTALEQEKNVTGRPVLFILEEFPTLGYMRQIESSAGLMAGYDVKLWTVMQDLSQLKAHYPKSWETFLGNAGIIEAFGNTDMTTLEYLSKRLGMSQSVQIQPENTSLEGQRGGAKTERETIVNVPLMAPYEIALAFEREKQNKLVLLAGKKPFALRRVYWKDLLNGY
ncbi:type IV secretory system conjugative DNA transfer family protein, partial [Sulfitobacter sp. F26169L]|uniref:type IV secretory system conjugative DNA transfer family protein n=1 Tax=Sulfitobacter sp. F26169L TaxID=2996015 RepID=UPI002260D837